MFLSSHRHLTLRLASRPEPGTPAKWWCGEQEEEEEEEEDTARGRRRWRRRRETRRERGRVFGGRGHVYDWLELRRGKGSRWQQVCVCVCVYVRKCGTVCLRLSGTVENSNLPYLFFKIFICMFICRDQALLMLVSLFHCCCKQPLSSGLWLSEPHSHTHTHTALLYAVLFKSCNIHTHSCQG